MKQIIFIVGPTAVGKSDLALELARRIDAEIISCDSMQVYKEIAIASNKPTEKERRELPHHLIDVASVEKDFDVARFNKLALDAISRVMEKGKVPVVVAGSGLYMQVLLDGIFEGKGKDKQLRDKLRKEASEKGSEALYERLKNVDPQAAEKIHPHDERRIIRALEVFETTNQPISELQKHRQGLWDKYEVALFGLRRERSILYDRINARVEEMFQKGLLEEVRALRDKDLSLTARHLIGVKEVMQFLEGEIDLETAQEKMKQNTRNFAKRQMTWFKRDKRIQWIDLKEERSPEDVAGQILEEIKAE